MNAKKDGPGKDSGRPADTASPKKPYATLDLKATEVKDPAAPDTADSAASGGPGLSKSDAKPELKPESKPVSTADASKLAPAAAKSTADAKPAEAKSTAGPTSAGPQKPDMKAASAAAQKAPDAKPSATAAAAFSAPPRSGIGSFLSHIAAGIVGGFLALLGADTIGSQLGLSDGGKSSSEVTAALQQRLARLEAGAKSQAGQPELAQKLAAAETRLAQLDEVARSVAALNDGQGKLAAETKALAEKMGAGGEAAARIAKLEETLATIASAAASDPQSGRIPQLAAISGKLKDLETTLATQLATLRKGVNQDIDTRIAQVGETSEAAKSGTQRVDRELSAVKTEASRLAQRVETIKADGDRAAQTLRVVQEETGGLRSTLDALKSDFESRFKAVARPDDVSGAVAPVASKLAALEQSLQGVVKSEEDRRTNAERIVLSLELNNLKRAIDRGQRYAAELVEVAKVAGGKMDLSALERFKDTGVPTTTELSGAFKAIVYKMIQAEAEPADGSVMDRLIAGAKSVVRVRKTEHALGDKGVEAVTARMEAALKDGRLVDVIEEAKSLSAKALAPAQDWLVRVEARSATDRAIAAIETQLKAALAGGAQPKPDKASN